VLELAAKALQSQVQQAVRVVQVRVHLADKALRLCLRVRVQQAVEVVQVRAQVADKALWLRLRERMHTCMVALRDLRCD